MCYLEHSLINYAQLRDVRSAQRMCRPHIDLKDLGDFAHRVL